MLSLLSEMHTRLPDVAATPHKVYSLVPGVVSELIASAVLSCAAVQDLRARVSHRAWCSDASDSARAVCRTAVHPRVAREMWRHRPRRGYTTRLSTQ